MANHPRFEITVDKAGKHRFTLTAKNGQVILTSQGYADRRGCLGGIDSVRRNCADDTAYERKEAAGGKHFFNLLAANKQVIGTSQMYAAAASRDNGIESVKTNGAVAEVHEGAG